MSAPDETLLPQDGALPDTSCFQHLFAGCAEKPLEQPAERRPAFLISGIALHFVHVGFNKAATHKAGCYIPTESRSVDVVVLVEGFVKIDFAHELIFKRIGNRVKFVVIVDCFKDFVTVFIGHNLENHIFAVVVFDRLKREVIAAFKLKRTDDIKFGFNTVLRCFIGILILLYYHNADKMSSGKIITIVC